MWYSRTWILTLMGQWDVSASYDINENYHCPYLSIKLLMEFTTSKHGASSESLYWGSSSGARYADRVLEVHSS